MTVLDVANTIGRSVIAGRVGVSVGSVTEAIRKNAFPASWWLAVKSLGDELGVEVTEDMFTFRSPVSAPKSSLEIEVMP